MKKLRITVGEKIYEVTVEVLDEGQPATAPAPAISSAPIASASVSAPSPAPAKPAPTSSGDAAGDVLSPLSGKVVEVMAKVGAQVQEGDQVATIEAMKMNTYVFAPKAGQVTEVLVTPGDGVEEGQVLVRIG